MVELLLQGFVGVVDAQLLEGVVHERLEAEDVQHACTPTTGRPRQQQAHIADCVDSHAPMNDATLVPALLMHALMFVTIHSNRAA